MPVFFDEWVKLPICCNKNRMDVGNFTIMYEWERPVMDAFAKELGASHGDVLEIGFGMGIFSECLQAQNVRSHTVIEAHPSIFKSAELWGNSQKGEIILIQDFWQNCIDSLGLYDAIFYDSFSPEETLESDLLKFFELATTKLLKPGGKLGFWTPHATLSTWLQENLLNFFESITIQAVRDLKPDSESLLRGFTSEMIVPIAHNPRVLM